MSKLNGYEENYILKLETKIVEGTQEREHYRSKIEQKIVRFTIINFPKISNGLTKIFKMTGLI